MTFRRDIEGLRAVAVLAVVLFHAGYLGGGFVGVDVFFVVSGFLITRLLWTELAASGRVDLGAFYGRRARRLLPASILVVVATVLASRTWLSPLRARSVMHDAVSAALYVSNYRFAAQQTDYLASHVASPLQHYWSLGVEEQFYALWPLLLLAVAGRRSVRRRVVSASRAAVVLAWVGVLSFAGSLFLTDANQPWAFFSLPTRAWELVAGALVALAAERLRTLRPSVARALGWLGLAAIAWSVVRISAASAFPGTVALVPVLGAAAIIVAGCARSTRGVDLVLDRPFMQFVGSISYPWYLWHWPVLVIAPEVVGHQLSRWQNLALAVASGALAYVTMRGVERPIRFASIFATRPRRSLALGASLTAVGVLSALVAAGALPSTVGTGRAAALRPDLHAVVAARGRSGASTTTVPEAVAVLASAIRTRAVPSNLEPSLANAAGDKAEPFVDGCDNTYTDAVVHRCAYGDTASSTTIVLFGDSHAAQYFPPLHTIALLRHWRLVVLTKATCPPFQLTIFSPVLGRTFRECDAWRQAAFARIESEHPAVVVMGAARHYTDVYRFHVYGTEWIAGIRASVGRVRAMGVPVIVLGATPKPPFDVPDCLASHLSNASECTTPRGQAVDAAGLAAERTATIASGGSYFDVSRYVCTRTTCAAIVGNLLVYRDDNHLTTTFTSWLTPELATALDRVRKT